MNWQRKKNIKINNIICLLKNRNFFIYVINERID